MPTKAGPGLNRHLQILIRVERPGKLLYVARVYKGTSEVP